MWCCYVVMLASPLTHLLADQHVSPIPFTRSQNVIPAYASYGHITLPVAHLKVDVLYPAGRRERGDLIVIYDPEGKHYFWRYAPTSGPSDITSFLDALKSGTEAVYVSAKSLVDFNIPGDLYVKEHIEDASSLDEAEQASIREIQHGVSVFEGKGYHTDAKAVRIRGIASEFACPPDSATCSKPKLVSIGRDGENWRLVFRNRWDQEVILNSEFDQVSTRRLVPLKNQ
jgi:hypothetical protein